MSRLTNSNPAITLCRWGFRALIIAATVVLGMFSVRSSRAEEPKVISGLKSPKSVVVGANGKIYVSQLGEVGKGGDGSIVIVDPTRPTGKITTFVTGLDDPKGLLMVGDDLYVADIKKIWKVDFRGKLEVFAAPEAFPRPPIFLSDLAYDGQGNFYVSDSGDRAGKGGAIFRITMRGKVMYVMDGEITSPQILVPSGILVDDVDHLLVAETGFGSLYRYDMITGTPQKLGAGFGRMDGIAKDRRGGIYVTDGANGRLFQIVSELEPPFLLSDSFQSAADIATSPDGRTILVPDTKAGTLTLIPVR